MKDIEYRAWDGIRMHPNALGATWQPPQKAGMIELAGRYQPAFSAVRMLDLQLYIGLRDKENNKVFVGDILNYSDNEEFCYIEYKAPSFIQSWKTSTQGFSIFAQNLPVSADDLLMMEVIGNIYENPELLKEKEDEG